MVVKTIRYIVTSALMRMRKNATGSEYSYLEQVAIEYLGERAPLDGYVALKCMYVTLGSSARVAAIPPDCMRINKIAVKSGKRVWTLTVDNNLAIPENIFSCETDQDVSGEYLGFWPNGPYGWYSNPQYGLGGGQNENYYRLQKTTAGYNIILEHNIPDGQLIIEYLSNGSDLNGDTMIDMAYAEPFRLYLISEYYLHNGSREEKSMYKEIQMQQEAAQWNANIMVNGARLYEIIDAMAQSSEFNLG